MRKGMLDLICGFLSKYPEIESCTLSATITEDGKAKTTEVSVGSKPCNRQDSVSFLTRK